MKVAQLRALAKQGESERLEFKASTGGLSAGMQTICAFLNSSHGGTLVFGIKDDGKIVGQKVTDKTRKEIAAEFKKLEPYVKIDVRYIRVTGDLYAIVFFVNPGEDAPYSYDGRAFVRNQSTTMKMPKEEYAYLFNQNNPTLWEKFTSNTCTLKDLDKDRIKEVVRSAVFEKRLPEEAMTASASDILKKFGLIVKDKLTNAAVILFCKDEQKQFMQSNLKLARFRGIDKSEFLDTKEFRGNAFDLYDKAMHFLHFSLPVAAKIEPGNPNRVETPAIPYKVLREAVINALIHRDYSHAGGSLTIAIYDNRVNISNIGFLPKGIVLNQLSKEHQSIRRNPLIADVFYVCGKIEKWGRGTINMIQDCKKAGNPTPVYEEVGGGFSVTLPLREPIVPILVEPIQKVDLSKLTDRQKSILGILKSGPLSRQQLMAQMHTPLTDRVMQLELAKLKNMDLVKSEGKAKFTVWFLVKI